MFCNKCGKEVNDDAAVCIHCGCAINGAKKKAQPAEQSTANKILGLVLGGLTGSVVFLIVWFILM